jgi:pimeloyl-ACP methyl ester carboxylesterase
MSAISSFKVSISQDAREDLRQRLRNTRWPDAETTNDWSQGVRLEYLKQLCNYWASDYTFELAEQRLNKFPQFTTEIDGLNIHFVHARSSHPDALPLVITHGWPGSVTEFAKIIEPLTQPEAHGGDAADAFHVVCPSLPGYGFSGKPRERGWGIEKIAETWDTLMARLGYGRYVASGGDWGSAVTTYLGVQNRGRCAALHLTMPFARPPAAAMQAPGPEDLEGLQALQGFMMRHSAYFMQHMNGPQTIGYSLVDSPVALAAWIIDKFQSWSSPEGNPESLFTKNELLDNLMMYWLPASGASALRLYPESYYRMFMDETNQDTVNLPVGVSVFPNEMVKIPRSWAQTRYKKIVCWNKLSKGGHFATLEQPELFTDEVRSCFRALRAR